MDNLVQVMNLELCRVIFPKSVPPLVLCKGKVFPIHAMKVYCGSRDIVLLILKLGTRCRQIVNFMALLLSFVKELLPIE
jgi:hypothetical protein